MENINKIWKYVLSIRCKKRKRSFISATDSLISCSRIIYQLDASHGRFNEECDAAIPPCLASVGWGEYDFKVIY